MKFFKNQVMLVIEPKLFLMRDFLRFLAKNVVLKIQISSFTTNIFGCIRRKKKKNGKCWFQCVQKILYLQNF